MKSKKNKLYAYLIPITIIILLLFPLHHLFLNTTIRCETDVIAEKHNLNGKLISINAKLLYSIYPTGNGSIRFKGFVTDAEGKYHHLDRQQYFTYVKKWKNGIYQAIVIEEQKYPQDDTNDKILSYFFDTIGLRLNKIRKIEKISDEVLIFSDLLTPSMICLVIK